MKGHHEQCKDRCHPDCEWSGRRLPEPEPVQDPGVEIKVSPVHGRGVFATKWWKPGDLIGIYEGTVVVDSDDPHVLWLQDEEERYFGILATGAMGYLNHADDGEHNAVLASNSPFVYARKNILPGEEIFISYGDDTEFEE